MTEERRGSVDAEENPGETGFAPPDQPAEVPGDKLVVSKEAAQAAAPPATMLDGVAVRQPGPRFAEPETPFYQEAPPRYGEQQPEAVVPRYSDNPPPYGEPPKYGEQPAQPQYGEQQPPRPGFAPHAPGAFWPGTQPQNPPPPPPQQHALPPGPAGPGGPVGPNWAPVPPPPSAPRRAPGLGLFAAVGLVIALVAGSVGAGIAVLVTGDDDNASKPLSLTGSNGEKKQVRDPQSVAGIAQRVLPSVVTIKVSLGNGEGGSGTGFVVDKGYIITNNHVVSAGGAGAAGSIEVVFNDQKEVPATVVGVSPANDVAVLKPQGNHELPALELGDSESLTVGDPVIAIGSPLGLDGSVTTGIISAKNRVVRTGNEGGGDNSFISALQTDAAINPGNSGGPLVDAATGKVIGMNTAIASLSSGEGESGSIGLGFAIPINKVGSVAQTLIGGGQVKRTLIGISMDLTYQGEGVRIRPDGANSITKGGPADKAGLKPGDIITGVDGKPITTPDDLLSVINSHSPGDKIKVTYQRGGQEASVEVTLTQG